MATLDRPRYFHLLSEAELRALRPVFQLLQQRRDRVLERWHELYVEHFGDARTLDPRGFLQVYGSELDHLLANLLDLDMEGFDADVRVSALDLLDRGVPFAEVVVSLHLFEESTTEQLRASAGDLANLSALYLPFDKLSHCRIILLASTYFAAHQDASWERLRGVENEAHQLAGGTRRRATFHGLRGSSAPMRRLYEQLSAVAGAQGPVLLAGETGTGKEVAARALHECSGVRGRFVRFNCKGDTRGEVPDVIQLSAQGGTLFLDEVVELGSAAQAGLLQLVDDPVTTFRVVASISVEPEAAVAAGRLDPDLLRRLHVHRLVLPPLRERRDDILILARHFAALFAGRGLRPIDEIDPDAAGLLEGYSWPGNVRELRSVIEHALTAGAGPHLTAADLPSHLGRHGEGREDATGAGLSSLAEAERTLIERTLHATGGNKLQASRILRISRHRLYDKLKRYALPT